MVNSNEIHSKNAFEVDQLKYLFGLKFNSKIEFFSLNLILI